MRHQKMAPKLNKAGGIVGRWQKGQSGNPKGRPSQVPFREAMAALKAGTLKAKEVKRAS